MRIRYQRPMKATGWSTFVMDLPDGLELPGPNHLSQWLKAMEATEHLIDWGTVDITVDEEGDVEDFQIDETD
jgi:hypothetical protein